MKDLVLNFLFRVVMGIIGIYLCNTVLSSLGIVLYIGINLLNLLVIGLFGISGFGLILAISIFSVL